MSERKLLLIASTGGHLAQLVRLSHRLGARHDSLWVTFDSPQSRSLLAGRRAFYVPYIAPRDWRGVLRAAALIRRRIRSENFSEAISTGAALALAGLPVARLVGVPATYIESVSRVNGPSLSGRVLAASRLTNLQAQHAWAKGRWSAVPSVLSDFKVAEVDSLPERPVRVFVTLGTIRPYRMDSLVDAIRRLDDERLEVVWQLGETTRPDLGVDAVEQVSNERFDELARSSDVVITHAGVGTILNLLEMGKFPIVVPRDPKLQEHVDDHQYQAADLVSELGIGLSRRPAEIDLDDILYAAKRRVEPDQNR